MNQAFGSLHVSNLVERVIVFWWVLMLVKKAKPGFWLMLVIVLGSCGAGFISGRPGLLWFLPLHIFMACEGLFDADAAHWMCASSRSEMAPLMVQYRNASPL